MIQSTNKSYALLTTEDLADLKIDDTSVDEDDDDDDSAEEVKSLIGFGLASVIG